jgi:RHS repeat-associated protein
MDEGVIIDSAGSFIYGYFLRDHLGNTRITFKPNGAEFTLNQSADYYPFGMTWIGMGDENKYLYTGKELQDETGLDWYDYGARFYDPQIGRWQSIDPLAEYRLALTPYNYVKNNPLRFFDLFGLQDTVPFLHEVQHIPEIVVTAKRTHNSKHHTHNQPFGIWFEIETGEVRDNGYRSKYGLRWDIEKFNELFSLMDVWEWIKAKGFLPMEFDTEKAVELYIKAKEDEALIKESTSNNILIINSNPIKKYAEVEYVKYTWKKLSNGDSTVESISIGVKILPINDTSKIPNRIKVTPVNSKN